MILTYFVGNIQVAVPGWLCFFFYLQRERNGVFVYRLLRPWWHDDRHFGFEVMVCILPWFISAFGNNPWRNIVLNNNEVHCNASNSDSTNKGCHKMIDGEFHPFGYWGPPRDSTVGSWVRVSVLQFSRCQLQAIQMEWNIKLVAIFKILQHIMTQLAYIAPVLFRDYYYINISWWRYQMETFSASLAIYAGNSPVTGEFPTQRPVTRSLGVFFYLRPNKRLSKQSWGWWFETPSCPLWRHRNVSCW